MISIFVKFLFFASIIFLKNFTWLIRTLRIIFIIFSCWFMSPLCSFFLFLYNVILLLMALIFRLGWWLYINWFWIWTNHVIWIVHAHIWHIIKVFIAFHKSWIKYFDILKILFMFLYLRFIKLFLQNFKFHIEQNKCHNS